MSSCQDQLFRCKMDCQCQKCVYTTPPKKEKTVNNTPSTSDLCGTCRHTFANHYVSFDGKSSGCAWSYEDQRDGKSTCKKCPGFTIIYRYLPATKQMGEWPERTVQQWER